MKVNDLIFILFCCLALVSFEACSNSKKAKGKTQTNFQKSNTLEEKYAQQLGVSKDQIGNIKLYEFVDQWIGTPYKYGGHSISGTDCSGFVGELYREVYHVSLPRTTADIDRSAKKISRRSLEEGDLIFFDINGKKSAHIGVYLINNKFVHASTSKGVIISDLENPYYQKAFSSGGRP